MMHRWDELPDFMMIPEIRPYWESLYKKRGQLLLKRCLDLVFSLILLVILSVPMTLIAILIKIDSPGPVFFRQERVTTYGKRFYIHKFRTMVTDAEKKGTAITVKNDCRITRIGSKLRHLRLDEIPQVLDVIQGNMSFVGTRPEVVKYVEKYDSVYKATLLMPAGITSEASIRYKDEDKLLKFDDDIDKVYVEKVLPEKMKYNLDSIIHFSLLRDISTMIRTLLAVLGKEYKSY